MEHALYVISLKILTLHANGYNLELFMLMRESPGLLHIEYIVSISQQYVNEGVYRTPYYVNEGQISDLFQIRVICTISKLGCLTE